MSTKCDGMSIGGESDPVVNALTDAGLALHFDGDTVVVEPEYLKLQSIHIKTVKRGRFIADPSSVPEELQDKNIFWVNEPVQVTAITESGREINVHLSNMESQVVHNHEVLDPRLDQ